MPTPTNTSAATSTSTPAATNTPTSTRTPTLAPTYTNTPAPTNTPMPTATPTTAPSNTPTLAPTNTPTSSGVGVNSLATGTLTRSIFTAANTFKRGSTVYVLAHVVDQSGTSVSGAAVSMTLLIPAGSGYCTFTATSDSNGNALGSCKVNKNAPAGAWDAHVNGVGTSALTAGSVTDAAFTEK